MLTAQAAVRKTTFDDMCQSAVSGQSWEAFAATVKESHRKRLFQCMLLLPTILADIKKHQAQLTLQQCTSGQRPNTTFDWPEDLNKYTTDVTGQYFRDLFVHSKHSKRFRAGCELYTRNISSTFLALDMSHKFDKHIRGADNSRSSSGTTSVMNEYSQIVGWYHQLDQGVEPISYPLSLLQERNKALSGKVSLLLAIYFFPLLVLINYFLQVSAIWVDNRSITASKLATIFELPDKELVKDDIFHVMDRVARLLPADHAFYCKLSFFFTCVYFLAKLHITNYTFDLVVAAPTMRKLSEHAFEFVEEDVRQIIEWWQQKPEFHHMTLDQIKDLKWEFIRTHARRMTRPKQEIARGWREVFDDLCDKCDVHGRPFAPSRKHGEENPLWDTLEIQLDLILDGGISGDTMLARLSFFLHVLVNCCVCGN